MRITTPGAILAASLGLLSLNAMAMDPKAMEDFLSRTTLSGKSYLDVTHINQQSNGDKVPPTGNGVDVKRFYVTIDHVFNDVWSVDLTNDFNYVSDDNETQWYVKKAYLQAKLSDAAVIRAGSADLPWVPYVENLYGYRYVENTLIDRLKFGTSADWGVHMGGKLFTDKVNYAVAGINGGGYKNPSRTNATDFTGRLGFEPIKGLNLAGDYYSGKLGEDQQGGPSTRTASRWDAVLAYVNPKFRLGTEYFKADNWNTSNNNAVFSSNPNDKADGYSVWGSVVPMEKFSLFARYDYAKPNKDSNSSLKDHYYNVGVSYVAYKNVDLALVYKHEKVDNGTISTSNGKIGGTNDGTYDEVGMWAQVKF
jgi:hypothetical protein